MTIYSTSITLTSSLQLAVKLLQDRDGFTDQILLKYIAHVFVSDYTTAQLLSKLLVSTQPKREQHSWQEKI